MSFEQTRFTLMALPQKVTTDGKLLLNIVFIPRNINPLKEVNTIYNGTGKAPAFAGGKPVFEIRVVNNPDEFPGKVPLAEKPLSPIVPLVYSTLRKDIYNTLKDTKVAGKPKYFDIDESRSTDVNPNSKFTSPKPFANRDLAIRKYLPLSYRAAFNFTAPRIKNAVTDDSYHCAMRDQTPPKILIPDDRVSWGKVYAHLMRQPLMAKQAGLIYETTIQLAAGDFADGGWIYAAIKPGTDYAAEQTASLPDAQGPFIKNYAARIPILKKNEERNLFAAILFPVMKPGEAPIGIYDDLFIEAARYNEGYATIVHANQPVSGNLLNEEQDGFHPQKDSGMRLGWEDEQILIWYLRQLAVDENATDRLDAPLGVAGYQVDVKKSEDADNAWESLTAVESNGNMQLEGLDIGAYNGEMPYQVYPSKIYDGTQHSNNYWLPMYFANWNNASLVLPDKTAARIYQNENEKNKPATISETYKAKKINTRLEYGNEYDFRVRLSDLSGGGPSPETPTLKNFPNSHIATRKFKRYVAPHSVTIINEDQIIPNTDELNFNAASIKLSRSLLGYPAVVYTGKYTDPVTRLAKSVQDILDEQVSSLKKNGARAFGIPDPDVESVELKVEVETLQLDNLASEDGREHYIPLYTTYRFFPDFDEDNAAASIDIPVQFKDVSVLNLNDPLHPYPVTTDNDFIAQKDGGILLPAARNIRITLRAIGKQKPGYWGVENALNSKLDSRFGKQTVIHLRQESVTEKELFNDTGNPGLLKGIYLQPDPVTLQLDPVFFKTFQGGNEGIPDIVQRLGKELDVAVNGLSLQAKNGERIQFWCSNIIRHSMAPDNSSIHFSNKNELPDHWLVATTLVLNRDWTWDSLDASSFDIKRKRRLGRDASTLSSLSYVSIGDLEIKKTASFQSIQPDEDQLIHREYTKIIIIDVVDNKPAKGLLPDTMELQYAIKPKFRLGHAPAVDPLFETAALELPTTINPAQSPKLIGAGIALSPYNRNRKYSATEARTRFLWLEMDAAPIDKNDALFCRVLAYSPDQLISNNHPSLMEIPKESPLPVDPEYIRVITASSAHEHSGLHAMQQMEKSTDPVRHFYLLPLPEGLHHESTELFGMFTYEFRYGHSDKIWSTAQGRFGRALRVAGLQHPAPNLICMVNRDEKRITVNAPYAVAVHQGRNVTATPPHTSIRALLYAQVIQADGLDYRNILLDELELNALPKRNRKEMQTSIGKVLKEQYKKETKLGMDPVPVTSAMIVQNTNQQLAWEAETVQQSFGSWTNTAVAEMLRLYGLPADASLSIICVEVYGQITNSNEHISNFDRNKTGLVEKTATVFNQQTAKELNIVQKEMQSFPGQKPMDPLNSQLGLYRILRTSPLTEVPFICCTV